MSNHRGQQTRESDEGEQVVTFYVLRDEIGVFTQEHEGDESDSMLSNIVVRPRQETPQGGRDRKRVSKVDKLLKLQDEYIGEIYNNANVSANKSSVSDGVSRSRRGAPSTA